MGEDLRPHSGRPAEPRQRREGHFMNVRCLLLLSQICLALLAGISCTSGRNDSSGFGAGVSPEALKAHLEFLADDALEGRRTGTRGHELAAKYLAAQFAALGLKGGMQDGSYYQKVPFRRTEVLPEATSLTLSGDGKTTKLKYTSDFLLLDTHQATQGSVRAPVVFVGYGVSAPELDYDDYAGLDVKGKIVAMLNFEAPPKFPPPVRAYYMDGDVKRETAAVHGAAGILYVRTPELEKKFPWPFFQRELAIGFNSMRWLDAQGSVGGLDARLGSAPLLNRAAAEALFDGEKYTLAEIFAASANGEPPPFTTTKTMTLRYESRHTGVESANVVAVMEGSDPDLKDEYVVFSTHLDHLGIGPAVDGDSIYNGAYDNASGCAIMLEVARAFSQLPSAPRRSVMFVAVTGEEQKLLGSDYFANNLPVPPGQVVADINFDEPIPFVPSLRDVIVYGSEHSSLGPTAAQAAEEAGFELSPDPWPEEGIFVRADHYSFVKQGVPASYIAPGYKSSEQGVDGLEVLKEWLVTFYHSPKDDTSQTFDYPIGARFARFAGLMGYKIAMDSERPRWNEGDFFGNQFGRDGGE
uniref:Peptidase n=1 Tax=uncultured bacterium N27-1E TaxID=1497526 RepID=A0A059U0F9_9BACT|nr:peptidase [uncultured bacterium N27-1E]